MRNRFCFFIILGFASCTKEKELPELPVKKSPLKAPVVEEQQLPEIRQVEFNVVDSEGNSVDSVSETKGKVVFLRFIYSVKKEREKPYWEARNSQISIHIGRVSKEGRFVTSSSMIGRLAAKGGNRFQAEIPIRQNLKEGTYKVVAKLRSDSQFGGDLAETELKVIETDN